MLTPLEKSGMGHVDTVGDRPSPEAPIDEINRSRRSFAGRLVSGSQAAKQISVSPCQQFDLPQLDPDRHYPAPSQLRPQSAPDAPIQAQENLGVLALST